MQNQSSVAVTKNEDAGNAVSANRAASATYNLVGVALAATGAIAFSLRAIFVKLAYRDMSDRPRRARLHRLLPVEPA
jgi:hypothetical protein